MNEDKQTEYKEKITNTFLKTVSAYANGDGGQIVFGITNDGKTVGLEDPETACLSIENKINESITPLPDFWISISRKDRTVKLTVEAGDDVPYMYKGKAYRRAHTSTVEVDRTELRRLALRGSNTTYDELPAENQNLTFETLSRKLKEIADIDASDINVMKTLRLYTDKNGYNNAAAILADSSNFPGIDIARLGPNINIILRRERVADMSVLDALDKAMEIYRDYYQYEEIDGAYRRNKEAVPEESFREAIANAVAHRLWDEAAQITVMMFDDRIEVTSVGGLPRGITEEEYLSGGLCRPRNPVLAGVLYRLGYIEMLGTGVQRIREGYKGKYVQPGFTITENSIRIILPVVTDDLNLTDDERTVYETLLRSDPKPISEITSEVKFGKTKTTELLNSMVSDGVVRVEGRGRGTKYTLR